MQTVGLVGGLGPESTIDYYRRILGRWQQVHPSTAPSVVIDSLDVDQGIELVRRDRAGLVDYLHASVGRLARAGCDFAALAANTPHLVFDELLARSTIPLVSIVEVCAQEARSLGLRRVGLLGTGFTMEASFYPEVFGRFGIDVVVPDESGRAWLHERYLEELLRGIFLDGTRNGLRQLVADQFEDARIEAVVLAGTELPLLLSATEIAVGGAELPLLDTTELHVRAIVQRLGSRARGDAEVGGGEGHSFSRDTISDNLM